VLTVLESLEDVEMTISLLKASNLGKVVNSITKSVTFKRSSDIQSTAKKLVTKWKEMVAAKQIKNGKSGKRSKDRKSARSTNNTSVTPQPVDSATNGTVKNEDEASSEVQDGFVRDYYDWRTGDGRRDKMISKFIDVLKPTVDSEEYCCYMKISADIEEELGARYGSDSQQYIEKYRDLHFNMKRNKDLCTEVLLGHIKPRRLVKMTSEELADKDLKEKRDADKKWAMEEARNDHGLDVNQTMTDEFKCGKCKKRQCKYSQAQTRGADEPMTTFVTCLNCGNRWKF